MVAIGRAPEKVLAELRNLRERDGMVDKIIIYPEFYDAKKCLVNRHDISCLRRYVKEIWLKREHIIVAVYPDYRDLLTFPDNILYVYPIHEKQDWDRLLRIDSKYRIIPGYPRGLTYLSVYGFINIAQELGFKTWFMGLTPNYIRYAGMFDYIDLTTYSIPGYNHEKIRRDGARALYSLAKRLLNNKIDYEITDFVEKTPRIHIVKYDIFYGQREIEKVLRQILAEGG